MNCLLKNSQQFIFAEDLYHIRKYLISIDQTAKNIFKKKPYLL